MSALGHELGRLRRRWARQAPAGEPRPDGRAPAARWRAVLTGPGVVLLATAGVGFLLVSQLRTSERFSQRLQAESEEDLARILASLTDEADALRDEIGDLKLQLVNLRNSSRQDGTADTAAREQLKALSVLAGTVPVYGPGLTLVVHDAAEAVRYDNLLDAVQELRDAGAEALAINDQRVGVASALSARDGRVLLDGTPLSAPYRIVAVGQATTLEGGLKIPGGVLDTLGALRGVRAEVQRSARLDLPALARPPAFKVARPVGSGP